MTDATLSPPQVVEDEPELSGEPRPAGDGWTRAGIVCGVVALATWASLALTRVEGGVAAMWIANGLVVAACLVAPRGQWPRLLVLATAGMIAVRLGHGDGWAPSLALTAVNLVEIATVVGTCCARWPRRPPSRPSPRASRRRGWRR